TTSAPSPTYGLWMITSALYPTLVLSPAQVPRSQKGREKQQQEKEKISEVRKRLIESAREGYKSPESPPLQRLEVSLSHVLIGVGIVGDSGFPVPFIRAHLAEYQFFLESRTATWFSKGVEGQGTLSLDCYTFNM